MTITDHCPATILSSVSQTLRQKMSNTASENDLRKELFSAQNMFFTMTGIKQKLAARPNLAFFNYHPRCPDALYDHNGQKVLIECKRFIQQNQGVGNVTRTQANGCDVRNGLLQLIEYCCIYNINSGVLVVFDTVGQQVDMQTQNLVSQFRMFLGVEIHMIWISSNAMFDVFI